jgi:hypothetical protein
MINYHLHENNWVVFLDNINFKTIVQKDINDIAKLISTNTIVIARDQYLTIEEQIRVLKMFKNPYKFKPTENKQDHDYKNAVVNNSEDMLLRITAELDKNNNPGVFFNPEGLLWHTDDPSNLHRGPITWFYGVKGMEGSTTSFINNIMTYDDLKIDLKNILKNVYFFSCDLENSDGILNKENPIKLVYENLSGISGLFFPFNQIDHFKGPLQKDHNLKNFLINHITQEKYCYNHNWKDGDVIFSDQRLSLHRRLPFNNMELRVLHRGHLDYPEQEYKK